MAAPLPEEAANFPPANLQELGWKREMWSAAPFPTSLPKRLGMEPLCCQPSGCLGPLCWCVTGHLRGPISKATRSGLGRIAVLSLQECQGPLPQGLTACTTLCQLLLLERNWSRCYINIYHSSFKQHFIWECEIPGTETFPRARSPVSYFSPWLPLPEIWSLEFPVN